MAIKIIRFVNIILVAVLAGVSLSIWLGFSPQHLSAPAWVQQQQHMLQSLRTLMIILVVISIMVTLVNAVMHLDRRRILISLVIAAAALVACLVITRLGIKTLDDQVLQWNAATVPDEWMEIRDRWWTLHKLRTLAELMALCIITWTSICLPELPSKKGS